MPVIISRTIKLSALSFLSALFSLMPGYILAQNEDRTTVMDSAGIFGGRTSEVEAAANALMTKGADVRVRTVQTYGSAGNLDRYEMQLEQQSPSWLGAGGERKNNLIVVLVALQERETGIYYGENWESALGSQWLRIQSDVINPYFRNGDYATGVIEGLREIQRVIQGGGQTQTQPTPAEGGGSATGWIVLLVLAALGAAVFIWMASRRNRGATQAARQKAKLAKQGAATGINELNENLQMLEIKVSVAGEKTSAREGAALAEEFNKAKRLTGQASQRYSELAHSAGNPEDPKLSEAGLLAIETEYQKILTGLREAREVASGLEAKVNAIQQSAERFPTQAAEVQAAIEAARTKANELMAAGHKSKYPTELVAAAEAALIKARAEAGKNRFAEAVRLAEAANEEAGRAAQATEDLPRKKEQAMASLEPLRTRITQTKELIMKGRETFERLADEYGQTSWQAVQGNGTEAENRVVWAENALVDARQAMGEDQQEWSKAMELIQKAGDWLDESASLMRSITELENNLKKERADAPGEIEAAGADIAKAWDYIKKFDDDIRESLEDDLKQAEQKNDAAKQELDGSTPDYFKLNRLAREANESADKILAQARSEHEAAERLRAKAGSALRDAQARVSIAREYIQDHSAVVQISARSFLDQAEDSLRAAAASAGLGDRVSLAEKAEKNADQAYAAAQRDVNGSWQGPSAGPGSQTTTSPGSGASPLLWFTLGSILSNSGNWGTPRPSNPRPFSFGGGGGHSGGGGGSSHWGSMGGGGARGGGGGSRGGGGGSSRW